MADLAVVREKAESARADALEAMVASSAEHTMQVAMLAERLSKVVEGLGHMPEETVANLLLAVAAMAAKGKKP